MTIFLNDERDYTPVVEAWVREFFCTMDEDDDLQPGNNSGYAPEGVKIIFDGYGDLETDDEYVENGNKSYMSFAVFVHKDSLTEDFPPHELTPWALIHRPKEEVCMWVWYDVDSDELEVIPFVDYNSTELDHVFVYDLIFNIAKRDEYEPTTAKLSTDENGKANWPFPK